MIIVVIVLCFIAFTHFAMSVKKIYCLVYEDDEIAKKSLIVFHGIAWSLLFVALYLSIEIWPLEIGIAAWVLLVQLSALLVAVCVNYFPEKFASFWKCFCIGRYVSKANSFD